MAYPRNLGDHQVFRESFQSVKTIADNGGNVPSGVTISNGTATFDGASFIKYDSFPVPAIDEWTIVVRVTPTDLTTPAGLFGQYFNDITRRLFGALTVTGEADIRIGGSELTSTDVVSLNQENHIVFTRDSSNLVSIYINNGTPATGTITTVIDQQELSIGAYDQGGVNNFLVGSMTDFAIYDRAWTPEEVQDDFENDTYTEVDSSNATVFLPLRTQFNDGTNQVTQNDGTVAANVIMGDGSTATTFPTQLLELFKGVNFAGIDDHMRLLNDPAVDFQNGENFSISFAAKGVVDNGVFQVVLQKVIGNGIVTGPINNFGYDVIYRADMLNNLQFRIRATNNLTAVVASTTVMTGELHHVVCTLDWSSDMNLYIDGRLESTAGISGLTVGIENSGDLIFGIAGDLATGAFLGSLIDFAMWDQALTDRQAQWLYGRFRKELNT